MSETIYLLTVVLPLITILLVFGMKYFAAIQQAKARLDSDDAYRQLAAQATAAQVDNATTLAAINASLADLKTRLASVEKMLREVE